MHTHAFQCVCGSRFGDASSPFPHGDGLEGLLDISTYDSFGEFFGRNAKWAGKRRTFVPRLGHFQALGEGLEVRLVEKCVDELERSTIYGSVLGRCGGGRRRVVGLYICCHLGRGGEEEYEDEFSHRAIHMNPLVCNRETHSPFKHQRLPAQKISPFHLCSSGSIGSLQPLWEPSSHSASCPPYQLCTNACTQKHPL